MAIIQNSILVLFQIISLVLASSMQESQISKDFHEQAIYSTKQRRQTSSSCSGSITINSQSDIDSSPIASCTSFAGDIILDGARGNITFLADGDIQLSTLDGSIYCRNNVGLENLNLYGIASISGSIFIDNAQSLVSLTGEQLTNVEAVQITKVPQFVILYIPGLKQLQSIELGGSPMTAENFDDDNGLRLETVGSFYIHDFISFSLGISFPLQNVTESFRFENNGPNSGININLLWANNITLQNVQTVTLGKMVTVNNSFEISNSETLSTIELQQLKFIGNSLYIQNNSNLANIELNSLKTIGESLVMTDNPALKVPAIGASNTFQNVASMDLLGPFSSLDSISNSFTALKNVSNGINIVFSNQKPPVDCSWSSSGSGKAFTGTWSSFFSCNGTVHTSGALQTRAQVGVGIEAYIYLTIIFWGWFYWISI